MLSAAADNIAALRRFRTRSAAAHPASATPGESRVLAGRPTKTRRSAPDRARSTRRRKPARTPSAAATAESPLGPRDLHVRSLASRRSAHQGAHWGRVANSDLRAAEAVAEGAQ